ncbi:TonB-dependent receptor [Glaciecola sp. 4H-3-7+YE-5]|nr:TonB-dependent receptor [Glaciecola sp. 4H-3-7+YE-5]
MSNQYKLKKVAYSVGLGLLVSAGATFAQESQVMEEVVATGSRLQGTAAAVIEERKNQAFVADILGSEQISRTGDSDAASALRRVTGLTLVDGKFIYVRGLGQRYSSARLNGASIPSPDLTRNVIPLDIFPANVIESLSVQKAYSPNMPAAFGGGNVDIRTKAIPTEFVAGIQVAVEGNTNNSDGYTYNRDENGIPQALTDAIPQYRGNFGLASIISQDNLVSGDTTAADQASAVNKTLAKSLPRNLALKDESLDPNYSAQAFIGNSFDEEYFGGQIGFLASLAYDNKWTYSDRSNAVTSATPVDNCSTELATADDILNTCYDTYAESEMTTEEERVNGLFSVGYKLDTHSISYTKIYIEDNEDESEISIFQNPSQNISIAADNEADRTHSFVYEERTLDVDQFRGQHTFLDYMGVGVDWQYTESRAETENPLNVQYEFTDTFDNGTYTGSLIDGAQGRANYQFVDMEDNMKSWGGNVTLPLTFKDLEVELKGGWDFIDRARIYTTSSFFLDNNRSTTLVNDDISNVLSITNYLTDEFIDDNMLISFNEPIAPEADDYLAAQKIDAGYAAFDVFYKGIWRISGGLRYEAFKQVSLSSSSLIFTEEDLNNFYSEDDILNGTVNDDDFYPALSLTYIGGDDYQLRFGYGETVVRPDLREVVPVAYDDPLTDIRTFGNATLSSTTLKNYDLRYELYFDDGDNLAFSAFYKDITNPIETTLSVGDASYTANFTNGDTGEVYGVEAEWLYDLSWVSDGFFTSGNITLSDSEVVVDAASAGNLTNTEKRMTGHSQYVVNMQLSYDSANGNHSGSLVYNVFGERIIASGINGREDAYEQPFNSLDATYSYFPDFNTTVKLTLKNLLGEDQEVTQDGIDVRTRSIGTTIKLSYRYDF